MEVHKTQVKFNVQALKEAEQELFNKWQALGGTKEIGTPARAAFLQWNRVNKFISENAMYEQDGHFVVTTVGESKGSTARVYYRPSVTTLPKPARKAIVPMNQGTQFFFMDLKAAEFIYAAKFAGMQDVLDNYNQGKDVYTELANQVMPKGTPRDVYKRIFIGYLYGLTPYRISKELGLSEAQAERLLTIVAQKVPALTALKRRIAEMGRKGLRQGQVFSKNVYYYPLNVEETEFSFFHPKDEWTYEACWSTYVQSALGWSMQTCIRKIQESGMCKGTLLTVFDSVLVEIDPADAPALHALVEQVFAPLKGSHNLGTNFYQAAYE